MQAHEIGGKLHSAVMAYRLSWVGPGWGQSLTGFGNTASDLAFSQKLDDIAALMIREAACFEDYSAKIENGCP